MSEEQNTTTTPQVEEVAAAKVQPEGAVETPVASDQVVESTLEKPVTEESKNDEAPAAADAVTNDAAATTVAAPVEEVAQEEPAASEKVQPEAENTVESSDDKALQENETGATEPTQEEAVIATNGDAPAAATEEQQPADATEETNGVCKRKAENGSEVVGDEKSPKKAKVVDEADNQAPVEETAA